MVSVFDNRGLVDPRHAKHVPIFINKAASDHKVTVYKNIRFVNLLTGDLRCMGRTRDCPS